jgi:hypothetical protein
MTSTTIAPRRADVERAAPRPWTVPLALAVGFPAGAALGVLARLWMRAITDDPDFTWSGTLFIVGAFAVFGAGQALSWSARRAGRRRPAVTAARCAAAVLTLPLFTGAGSIMLPTILAASLAAWRTDWKRVTRLVLALLAVPVAVFVVASVVREFGLLVQGLTGVAGFVGIYTTVIVALRPTVAPVADGWRMRRRTRVVLIVSVLVLVALAAAYLVAA